MSQQRNEPGCCWAEGKIDKREEECWQNKENGWNIHFTIPIWYHIMVNKHEAKALYPNMMSPL